MATDWRSENIQLGKQLFPDIDPLVSANIVAGIRYGLTPEQSMQNAMGFDQYRQSGGMESAKQKGFWEQFEEGAKAGWSAPVASMLTGGISNLTGLSPQISEQLANYAMTGNYSPQSALNSITGNLQGGDNMGLLDSILGNDASGGWGQPSDILGTILGGGSSGDILSGVLGTLLGGAGGGGGLDIGGIDLGSILSGLSGNGGGWDLSSLSNLFSGGIGGGTIDDYLRDYGIPLALGWLGNQEAQPYTNMVNDAMNAQFGLAGNMANLFNQNVAAAESPYSQLIAQMLAGTIDPMGSAETKARLGQYYDTIGQTNKTLRDQAQDQAARANLPPEVLAAMMSEINTNEGLQRQGAARDIFTMGEDLRRNYQTGLQSALSPMFGLPTQSLAAYATTGDMANQAAGNIMNNYSTLAQMIAYNNAMKSQPSTTDYISQLSQLFGTGTQTPTTAGSGVNLSDLLGSSIFGGTNNTTTTTPSQLDISGIFNNAFGSGQLSNPTTWQFGTEWDKYLKK